MKTYLNLGCGKRYHSSWTNIDIAPRGDGVIKHDLSRGIPAADNSIDVIYSCAVLEHIRREHVPAFLQECRRVLKPNGIVRIAVPDLERICRIYLQKLEAAAAGDPIAAHDYDWMMLEVADQFTREKPGGEMGALLLSPSIPNESFVLARTGDEAALLRRRAIEGDPPKIRVLRRVRSLLLRARRIILSIPLGPVGARAYEIGRFRLSGEVHQWMYDRFSLARLLRNGGFEAPVLCQAAESSIPNWVNFHLEVLPDGSVIKPDLFYMEARKPSA